jgi:hypothetical protein
MRSHLPALLVGLTIALAAPSEARAALGGDATSIAADSAALGGTREIRRAGGFEVHVLRLPSGTVIHEYLRDEKVFAVAWGGPVLPDLRRLLGAYFEPYVQSPQGRGTGHHHMRQVVTPEWVVQSAGHHQSFVGRAWLPTQLPAELDLDTVRAW